MSQLSEAYPARRRAARNTCQRQRRAHDQANAARCPRAANRRQATRRDARERDEAPREANEGKERRRRRRLQFAGTRRRSRPRVAVRAVSRERSHRGERTCRELSQFKAALTDRSGRRAGAEEGRSDADDTTGEEQTKQGKGRGEEGRAQEGNPDCVMLIEVKRSRLTGRTRASTTHGLPEDATESPSSIAPCSFAGSVTGPMPCTPCTRAMPARSTSGWLICWPIQRFSSGRPRFAAMRP